MECEEKGLTQLITDVIAKVGGHEEFETRVVHRLKEITIKFANVTRFEMCKANLNWLQILMDLRLLKNQISNLKELYSLNKIVYIALGPL